MSPTSVPGSGGRSRSFPPPSTPTCPPAHSARSDRVCHPIPAVCPPTRPDRSCVGNGPFGKDFNVHANSTDFNPSGWRHVCGDSDGGLAGRAACDSKAIRLPFTIRDNGNNTLTLNAYGQSYTFKGKFPAGGFNVVFKDHNYTPDKDGKPVGHTWHWDNIIIK